jgi:hypothetical protein
MLNNLNIIPKFLSKLTSIVLLYISQKPFKKVLLSLWLKVIFNIRFINTFYIRNEHLWLDGYLFDFLQKKTADI